jgi:uncharacterized protein DUF929
MSKKATTSSPTSRGSSTRRAEALEELRLTQERSRRRSRLLLAGGVVTAVLLIAVALVVTGLNRDPEPSKPSGTANSRVVKDVTGVPVATYDQIGAGTSSNPPTAIEAPALSADGKPRVLYVGAEYCPFCAAQRWAIVAALSRFGSFTDLGQTTSAADDVYPNTPTLTFHGSSYTSDHLSFTGVETATNKRAGASYEPLDELSAEDQRLVAKYDAPPYVQGSAGGIPFVDLGGRFVSSGASFDPQLLAGKTHAQIAAELSDPNSDIAQAVEGTANVYTAALCELTGDEPGAVCSSPGVQAAASKLRQK